MNCTSSTDFFVKSFSFSMAYVDSDIARNRVGENSTQPFRWQWHRNEESILPIVTLIVDTNISSIMNAALAGLAVRSQKIRECWGCREEPHVDGGLYHRNVTAIFNNITTAGSVKTVMKLYNTIPFCLVYCGQQADSTAGAQTLKRGGPSYSSLDDINWPPADDIFDDIGEESDDAGETRCPNPKCLLTTKTGFQMFKWKLHKKIIRQQQYLEVIRTCAPGLFAHYEQCLVADGDVAWLPEHNHIVNPHVPGFLVHRKRTSSCPATDSSLWGWNALAGWLFKNLHCGWVFFWQFGGWMDEW